LKGSGSGAKMRNSLTMQSNDSSDLTRVGPGTVMGSFMRQYWMPACLSSEVKADGDPVRLMILCEKLIAFRDSSGRVGIMDHRCPHRCASLFIGRNEENGIRCVYHGWKFDVDGVSTCPRSRRGWISRKRSMPRPTRRTRPMA
jgi:phenylpropionate dioxygenase-like ring-hydroxylating dioxygenase large terminal subunit